MAHISEAPTGPKTNRDEIQAEVQEAARLAHEASLFLQTPLLDEEERYYQARKAQYEQRKIKAEEQLEKAVFLVAEQHLN